MEDLSLAMIEDNAVTRKNLKKVDGSIRKKIGGALIKFSENPLHPGLDFEKISNTSILYSIRASIHIRIYMANYEGNFLTIIHVGNHDIPAGY